MKGSPAGSTCSNWQLKKHLQLVWKGWTFGATFVIQCICLCSHPDQNLQHRPVPMWWWQVHRLVLDLWWGQWLRGHEWWRPEAQLWYGFSSLSLLFYWAQSSSAGRFDFAGEFPHAVVIQDADFCRCIPMGIVLKRDTGSQSPAPLVSYRRSPVQGADIPNFSCLTCYFVRVSFLWLPGLERFRIVISH